MSDDAQTILVRCTGHDRPGITTGLLGVLAEAGVEVYDIEQVVVRERLTLDLLVEAGASDEVLKELLYHGWEHGLTLDFEVVEPRPPRPPARRSVVTVIGRTLTPAALQAITGAIAHTGGNIDRIHRLSRYPVVSYEFVVVDGDRDRMREALMGTAASHEVDVAVQPANLERRAKRLVVMDVDSTLIQDEVIDRVAEAAGCHAEVAALTARAMADEIDFTTSLQERVRLLEGLPVEVLDQVRERLTLTPGARTFVRTLNRLGYTVAVVSGGFSHVVDRIAEDLGIAHAVANRLEVHDGRLTGRLEGQVVDRAGKAAVLRRIAESEQVPLEQTVAIGDGANDLDMLAAAGLGIAFNAKPVVREHADTAVSVPYLDAILFLLGISRDEVEDADGADPDLGTTERIPVPGMPPL